MKTIPLLLSIAISSAAFAADEPITRDAQNPEFNMTAEDTELLAVTRMVNTFCRKYVAPVELKNPHKKVTVVFDGATCAEASAELRRLDQE